MMGQMIVLGLDYTAVEATLRMLRVPAARQPKLLADLQLMELEVVRIRNERKPANG